MEIEKERVPEIGQVMRKERIFGDLEYMDDKDLQEIAAHLYNMAKTREELKLKKERDGGGEITKRLRT